MLPGSRPLSWATPPPAILRAPVVKPRPAAAAAPAAAPAAASSSEDDEEATFVCAYTKKTFKSRGAYESYTASKKYKALAAKAAVDATRASERSQQLPAAEVVGAGRYEAAGQSSSSAANAEAPQICADEHEAVEANERAREELDGLIEDCSDSDGSEDGWVDVDEPWVPRWGESLFDGHVSATLEENMRYMRSAYGFSLPEEEALINASGLFAFLQQRVCLHHTCVLCARRFRTLDACREHMVAKAHCRLDLECEETLAELAPFYDLERSWLARRWRVGYVDGLGELVLPRGRRLGHRSLQRLYAQRGHVDDMRLSVRAARHDMQARMRTRMMGFHGRATRPRRDAHGNTIAQSHAGLSAAVALREEAKRRHGVLVSSFAFAKGTSKALASSYVHKADFADNKHARAITHHGYGGFGGGAHYTMAGSKQFQKGVRVKGVVSRHSVQGARLGAARRNKAAGNGNNSKS